MPADTHELTALRPAQSLFVRGFCGILCGAPWLTDKRYDQGRCRPMGFVRVLRVLRAIRVAPGRYSIPHAAKFGDRGDGLLFQVITQNPLSDAR